jgi:hypothetical protein
MQRAAGKNATASCDGWTGENFHHYIAFMAVVDKEVCHYSKSRIVNALFMCAPSCPIQVHTVRVHDASKERKTAENLFVLMVDVIKQLRSQWNVTITAFTTDASGESRKARKLLLERFPNLVCPDCYAHQVSNLLSSCKL